MPEVKHRFALTGATGHVGYALARELEDTGEDYRILIRKDTGVFEGMRCEKVLGDITDYDSLVKAFSGCDIVFHLAGCIEIRQGNEDKVRHINVDGTQNVVRACQDCGVKRLVYMSSVDTYMPLPAGKTMTERKEYYPDFLEGAYATTKAEATQFVLSNQGVDGLDVVVVQPSACIGPYDFKVSSIGEMVRMYIRGEFNVTLTFGAYNFVDVRDVARGTHAAALRGRPGECYLLTGEVLTVGQMIQDLADICGRKRPKARLTYLGAKAMVPFMEVYYKASGATPLFTSYSIRKLCANCNFSYAKAQKELGYKPMPAKQSLADMVFWIGEHPLKSEQKKGGGAAAPQ